MAVTMSSAVTGGYQFTQEPYHCVTPILKFQNKDQEDLPRKRPADLEVPQVQKEAQPQSAVDKLGGGQRRKLPTQEGAQSRPPPWPSVEFVFLLVSTCQILCLPNIPFRGTSVRKCENPFCFSL